MPDWKMVHQINRFEIAQNSYIPMPAARPISIPCGKLLMPDPKVDLRPVMEIKSGKL